MAKAFIIGRFQPVHLGHVYAIKEAMKKFDEVVIGIGSSNESSTFRNPFSFDEREQMLRLVGIKCKVVGIPDIKDDKEWCEQIFKTVDFDVAITGSEWVKKCFYGRKKVGKPDFLLPEVYSGVRIREKMSKGEKWEDLVPKKVADFIKKIGGEERIKESAEREF
ncbi:MAG TPA: nicotinamide-nucleotide adenylyltransferase [archaeon]|nr:nicotinamide-nucleotide adenylyltransferase [archaeon]